MTMTLTSNHLFSFMRLITDSPPPPKHTLAWQVGLHLGVASSNSGGAPRQSRRALDIPTSAKTPACKTAPIDRAGKARLAPASETRRYLFILVLGAVAAARRGCAAPYLPHRCRELLHPDLRYSHGDGNAPAVDGRLAFKSKNTW